MSSPLVPYLARNYAQAKRRCPSEGRRKWRLDVAHEFWTAVRSGSSDSLRRPTHDPPLALELTLARTAEFVTDPDPLDGVSRDAPELGLIVRTDFSDEASWEAFCTLLQDSEKELISGGDGADENMFESEQPLQHEDTGEQEEDDSDNEDEDTPPTIFRIINPSSPRERELLTNVSNLTVLRLFNDVDVRPSPNLPHGAKRIHPPNRLVDCYGWQEFYQGKNVWVYDAMSNIDRCVRAVNQSGDMYGIATGDSWRARASHISELQVSLFSEAIKIDFGGLDRWDFNERQRNMMEAEGI